MPLKFVDWEVEIDGAPVEQLTFLHSRNRQSVAFTSVDESLAKEFTLSGMDERVRSKRGNEGRRGPPGAQKDAAAYDTVTLLAQAVNGRAQGLFSHASRIFDAAVYKLFSFVKLQHLSGMIRLLGCMNCRL